MVKNAPANTEDIETWAGFLGRENPLEEAMATHSSILAWKIPWTEETGELPEVAKELDTTEQLTDSSESG